MELLVQRWEYSEMAIETRNVSVPPKKNLTAPAETLSHSPNQETRYGTEPIIGDWLPNNIII